MHKPALARRLLVEIARVKKSTRDAKIWPDFENTTT
jgi:hypothetical protein